MAETKTTTKKAPAKKPAAKKAAPKASPSIVKMVHEDGRTADVHPSMVDAYKSGGYREA
jgi:hypothetical protein